MSETSRGRVTITLGRSGQVVKRSASEQDGSYTDSLAVLGTKRSVRDRLGSNCDSSMLQGTSKRLRGDVGMPGLSANGFNGIRVGKDDLRYKLMQKDAYRRAESDSVKRVDLREKLSKAVQYPVPSHDTRQHAPPNPDPQQHAPPNHDSRQRVPQSHDARILGRIPSTRSADDFPQVDSISTYSPWNLDHLRCRSPDRNLGPSRGLSAQRNVEELQRGPLNRTFDNVRHDASMPVNTAPFMTSSLPPVSAKPVTPVIGQLPPSSGLLSKRSYPVQGAELPTVDGLLQSLGLGKYAILFKAEEVDMTALKQMGENDLKELGIPMGPRKKILLALAPRSKRPPPP